MYTQFPTWVWNIPQKFNIGVACTDRHLGTPAAQQIAMIVEDDGDFKHDVCRAGKAHRPICASVA